LNIELLREQNSQ